MIQRRRWGRRRTRIPGGKNKDLKHKQNTPLIFKFPIDLFENKNNEDVCSKKKKKEKNEEDIPDENIDEIIDDSNWEYKIIQKEILINPLNVQVSNLLPH